MQIRVNRTTVNVKKTSTSTITLSLFCFGILYFIYFLRRIYLVNSNPAVLSVLEFVEWPIYILGFLNAIIKARYKVRELALTFAIGCIFFMGYVTTGYAELLKALMIIVALENVDYRKLFEIMYHILVASIVMTVMLYLLGISDAGVQRRGANALGYSQANSVGYVLMVLTLLMIVRKDTVSGGTKVLLAIVNLVGYVISDGRAGFLLACVALLFSNNRIYRLIKRKRLIQTVLMVIPMILMIFTILTAVLYEKNTFVQKMDILFSTRISMNYYVLKNDGITLWGQPIRYHGIMSQAIYNPVTQTWSKYMTIDSAYMSLIIGFGLLATIVVGIAYIRLMKKLFRCDAIRIAFVMTILSLYGLSESAIVNIYAAFPFILLLNKRMKSLEREVVKYDS